MDSKLDVRSKLLKVLETANSNYSATYEESSMVNVRADDQYYNKGYVYIEEFVRGNYTKSKFFRKKSTLIEVYFYRFTQLENNADIRENLRMQIESEIVIPFMDAYNNSGFFDKVDNWDFYYPITRFDANEVSVMLQFKCDLSFC